MPRDINGSYVLPPGNPVQADTLIQTAWANPTMADIAAALTESLDRYGRGGMLLPLYLSDGAANAPGLSFINEPDMGLFRESMSVLGVAVHGVAVAKVTDASVIMLVPLNTGAINASGPITGNLIGNVTGNVTGNVSGSVTGPVTGVVNSADITSTGVLKLADGTVVAPALAFTNELGTGLSRPAANALALSVIGVERARFTNAAVTVALPLSMTGGGVASRVAANVVQLGEDATATRNLTIRTNADGTFTIARGNAGATTQDIITIDAAGVVRMPQTPSGSSGPSFSVYANTTQAISAGTAAKVIFQVEEWDFGNCFDMVTTSRFQPNVPGYYQLQGVLRCATGAGPYICFAEFVKNGTSVRRGNEAYLGSPGATAASISAVLPFNGTTDYVEMWGTCSQAGSFFQNPPGTSYLQGWLVRPT